MAIKLKVQSDPNVQLGVQDNTVRFGLGDSVQVVQSGDYDDLTNRPQINGVTLTGNKTTEDLGIEAGVIIHDDGFTLDKTLREINTAALAGRPITVHHTNNGTLHLGILESINTTDLYVNIAYGDNRFQLYADSLDGAPYYED